MKLTIFVIIIGLFVVFSGFPSGSGEEEAMDNPDAGPMGASPGASASASTSEDTMGTADGEMMSGGLLFYTNLETAQTQAESAPVLLYFNASWCSTCRAALADIASRQAELGDITVFDVDYDEEKQLKRKYGVTVQHTFVQIDENGEALTMWNGGSIDMILHNVVTAERS